MTEDQLDRIDRNIALAGDGRLSMSELATKVGLSKLRCRRRVSGSKEMAISGVTKQLSTATAWAKVTSPSFLQVKLSDTRSAALDAFNRAVGGAESSSAA